MQFVREALETSPLCYCAVFVVRWKEVPPLFTLERLDYDAAPLLALSCDWQFFIQADTVSTKEAEWQPWPLASPELGGVAARLLQTPGKCCPSIFLPQMKRLQWSHSAITLTTEPLGWHHPFLLGCTYFSIWLFVGSHYWVRCYATPDSKGSSGPEQPSGLSRWGGRNSLHILSPSVITHRLPLKRKHDLGENSVLERYRHDLKSSIVKSY